MKSSNHMIVKKNGWNDFRDMVEDKYVDDKKELKNIVIIHVNTEVL